MLLKRLSKVLYNVTGTSKTISGLKPKTSHTYAVRAKNSTQTGAYSATKSITTLAQSPGVPSNIRKTVTETAVTLTWNAVTGAKSYDVLFNGRTYNVTTNTKTFTGLTAGTAYTYQIRSKNADASSAYTSAATATTAPKAPSTVKAVSTENSITISWNAVTGARYYRLKFGKEDILVNGTSYTLKGLTANTSYSYQVCSQGPDGTGSYTASKSIKTAPQVPSAPTATVTKNSATVKWNAVTGATGYDLLFNNTVYATTATSRTVNGLTPGTSYSYSVRAKNAGGASSYTAARTISTIPNPPAAPANVNASVTPDSATVSWNPVSGATSYDVLFNNRAYNVTATSKTFTGLTENTSYSYAVRANNAGGSGAYSASKTIKTPIKPPAVPSNPAASATADSVTVSWGRVTGATSYDLQFNGTVYNTTATSRTMSGLTAGTSYNYAVRAKNGGGTSAYSAAKSVTTIPGQPANVSARASSDSVTVSWNAAKGAASYDLKFNGTVYNTTATSKTVTGLREGTNYSYAVCAKNGSGSGAYTASRSVRTPLRPPAVPSGVKAAVSYNSATVSWNASAGASGYDLVFNGKSYDVAGTSKTVSGLAANTNYSYSVRAKNQDGASAYSASQTVRTLIAPPAAPGNVTATAGSDTVTVSWGGVSGATGYDVKFGGAVYSVAGISRTFTGLKPKTGYAYAVRAKNAGGAGAYSAERTIQTLPAVPAVPVIYAAVTSAHSIDFAWHAVDDADSYELLFDGKAYALTELEKKMEGLKADTEYTYRIRAKNITGVGDYSALQKIRTLLETPGNITAEPDDSMVCVKWSPVEGATSYELEFDGKLYEVTGTMKEITGLNPETDHNYRVRAKNSYVYSKFSGSEKVKTLEERPATPEGIRSESTMDTIIISWDKVQGADDYEVVFDDMPYKGTHVDKARPNRIYRVFGRLKPNRSYGYTVRARRGKRYSHASPLKRIKTRRYRRSGLPHLKHGRTYPDGRLSHTGLDPVNALTGAFLWSYTWLEDYGKDSLHFTVMYDSQREDTHKALGWKWAHSFDYLLYMDEENVYFSTPYGEVTAFIKDTETGKFRTAEEGNNAYVMEKKEDGSYSIKDADGAEFFFDENLNLMQMNENGLASYQFHTDEKGQIVDIESRHGSRLTISYTDGHISQVTDTMGNAAAFSYNGDFLVSAANAEGKEIFFTYDDMGNLLTVSDFTGVAYVSNQYDAMGRITSQTTAGRGESSAVYDEENRTTTFTDGAGYNTIYHYDEKLCVTAIELGASGVQNKYNENGQLTEWTDSLGNTTKMEYDECGRMNRVIHPDGTEEGVTYNGHNQPVKVVNRDGSSHSYAYDERNNLIWAKDERGNVCTYTYDDNDNLVSYTDKCGNVWNYAYDQNNHLKQAQDPEGNHYTYSHDALGRLTTHTSPAGKTTAYEYSSAGDLISITDGDGSIVFAYDENGNHTGTTDRMGNCQRLAYNGVGQVIMATDFMGNEYHFAYDENGNLVTETDPSGSSTEYTYDAMGNRTSVTDPNGGITSYVFDTANRLTQINNPDGGNVCYAYDSLGQVVSVTDPLGRSTDYVYDTMGRVTAVTNALGHSVRCTYDEAGNLLTKTDEEGVVTEYSYDVENRLSTITTEAGTVSFSYDSLGRVISTEDMDGYAETLQYDGDGNLTEAADKENKCTVYVYDENGHLTEETAPDGAKTKYAYDRNGNCTKVTDAGDNEYCYEYDAEGHMTKTSDPLGNVTSYGYDAMGRLISVTDAKGGVYTISYDGNGNRVKETDPAGGVRTYTYDCMNRLTGITDEEGYQQSCAYDACGNMVSCTDANGNTWAYEYDAVNRLTGMSGADGAVYAYAYTNTGRLAKVTDPEGAETTYVYDVMGRLESMSDALGNSLGFTYDSVGRVLTQTDANGNITSYSYSPAGNLLSVALPEGGTVSYTYNALGQVLTETDALGNVVTYEYDSLGRTTSVTDAMGGRTAFTYTADGRIATVTDADGNITQYGYDACGNLIQAVDALGNTTVYEYDAVNNQIRECLSEDGDQKCITLYQYDKKGRVVKEINPMSDEKSYTYDGYGNLTGILDEDGNETTVCYDLNNRPVGMCYSGGREASFRYNKRGGLVELKDWNGTVTMEYGVTGRLAKVTDHNGHSVAYTYDAAGNRTGITYPDGSTVLYAYDRDGRLTGVTDEEGKIAQYGYDAAGNVLSIKQPGNTADYTYNANRQPVKAIYGLGGGTSMEETFSYDMLGRIIGRERTGSAPGLAGSVSYAYDALGQLLSYMDGQTTESYTYDALGNRSSKSINGTLAVSYQYNAMNQLVCRTENGVQYGYGYDKRGNLTEERRGEDIVRKYIYDATGHMVLGQDMETGGRTEYGYNALYMRVKNLQTFQNGESSAVREVNYVPDYLNSTNNDLMAYEKGVGVTRAVYGHRYERLNQRVTAEALPVLDAGAEPPSPATFFFQPDLMGSPLFAANRQGDLLRYTERGVWGDLKESARNIPGLAVPEESLRFTNYCYDPVIGKYFAQARFYDSLTGRMLAADPVKRGMNGYPYCENDPVDYVDPTGEVVNLAGAAIGGFAGGVIGGVSGFAGSVASQLKRGKKPSLRKAAGAAANGAVVGAARGAMIGSGAAIHPAARAAADFVAGAAGNALEQKITRGKVDWGESLTGGLTNAVSGAIYGNKPFRNFGSAFGRGAGAGAATAAINHIADALRNRGKGHGSVGSEGNGARMWPWTAGSAILPYGMRRSPGSSCGDSRPLAKGLGYTSGYGFRFGIPRISGPSPRAQKERGGFSLKDFFKDVAVGAVTEGLASAAFFGADKAVGALWNSLKGRKAGFRGSNLEGSDRVEQYWEEYYSEVGCKGDYIEDLIQSAKRRPYGRHGNLSVVRGESSSYLNGTIQYGNETKRWEFIEEFLHYNVDRNNSLRKLRKMFRAQLKANGIHGNVGRVAEEMAVKNWLLEYSNLLGLDNATKKLLKNQIEQLGRFGIEYGY